MPQTALVTGGAGFIGSHLVDALLAKRWNVVVVDDLSTGSRKNVDRRATLKVMDIRSPKVVDLVKKIKPDAIFHLAAQASVPVSVREPIRDAEINLHATLGLMEAAVAAGTKRFIFAGTGGALSSEHTKLPTDEAHAATPSSPYAIAKVASELYGRFYRHHRGLGFTSLRFANVYGPRQNPHGEAGVVAIFCKRMLAQEPLRINGTGKQTRDYIYVGDVVSALMAALAKPKAEGPYHIGTGREVDVLTLFANLTKMTGYALKAQKGPPDIGAPRRSVLDAAKAKKELSWQPAISLEQGLAKTLAWFCDNA